MQEFSIGPFTLGENHRPFVVAEMSGNHNGSLNRAMEIVEAAAAAGVHALKLQTYTADTMTLDLRKGDFLIYDKDSLWYDRTLYSLYEEAYTPWEWHEPIFKRCAELGMTAFSSPFDETAVDFLESIDAPAYKIASMENTDWPLLKKVAATGKPVIMSTGVSTLEMIASSVAVLREAGCEKLILLKCTSSYPAPPDKTNIRTIAHLQKAFGSLVGISDHTLGIGVSVASVAFGTRFIEKHITLRRSDGGVDSAFSLEPEEFKMLVDESERAFLSLGFVQYGVDSSEKTASKHKRSIYVAQDIAEGEVFTKENIRVIRPGNGLEPRYYETLLGKKARHALDAGTPLSWDLLL